MGRIGWCLLLAGAVATACEGTKASSDGTAGSSGSDAKGGSAGTSSSGGQSSAGVAGSLLIGIGAQTDGGRAPVDLSAVVAPVVRCHNLDNTGGQGGGDAASGGDATGGVAEGGAPWDEDCSPPPSQCVDGLTLVYFDQGECVRQHCVWEKKSLMCQNQCQRTGCQDSITTK